MHRLKVRHTTVYRYRRPVQLQQHRLMLLPRATSELRLLGSEIRCTPAASISWSEDAFGNPLASVTFGNYTDTLLIDSELLVEKTADNEASLRAALAGLHYPFQYSQAELREIDNMRHPYHGDLEGQLSAWARRHIYGTGTYALALLEDLNNGIHEQIGYRMRTEEGTHPPLQTLTLREGACRDLATLFIETARHLGFAARAVSGYVYDADSPLSTQDAGTTHAWADIHLPGAGWIAFDPTNRRMGGRHLIPVAIAGDITQIVPISGGFVGTANDFLNMSVEVWVSRMESGEPY